ncbi:hypothetical protein GQ457_09G010810 [Hibiscus cannabinus]
MVSFWAVRYARNKVVHEGIAPLVNNTMSFVVAFLRENDLLSPQDCLRLPKSRGKWQAPIVDVVKLNFDVAYDSHSMKSISGFICRDKEGFILAASSTPHWYVADPFQAEALACLAAVNFASDLVFTRVIVEGDSLTFNFVCREANDAAHILAQEGKAYSNPMYWIEEVPPKMMLAATKDCEICMLRCISRFLLSFDIAGLVYLLAITNDVCTFCLRNVAEVSAVSRGSLRLYVVEVNPEQDPFFERFKREEAPNIIFPRQDNAYLNLHELGMKEYSEAMEDTVTSEEAQDLFDRAAEKFKELTALALFNWGNVHMSRARKRLYTTDDGSRESVLEQIKTTYDWAKLEYTEACKKYEEALRTKPDFYEAILVLGQQQFEQAKLSWYYAIGNNVDLQTWPSENVLQLYNNAEENMEKGHATLGGGTSATL